MRAWDLATGKLKIERKFRPASLGPEADDDELRREQEMLMMFDHRRVDVGADGNTLVMGMNKDVSVYALDTGKERFKLAADEQHVQSVVLSADTKRLATAGPGPPKVAAAETQREYQVTVWDMKEAKQLCRFRAPGDTFFPVMGFTPDGKRVVTGSGEEALRFWDAETGKAVGSIELPRKPTRVAFSPDGKRVAIAFYDPTVLVFDVSAAMTPAKEP
jgi:WD40 repeat protein